MDPSCSSRTSQRPCRFRRQRPTATGLRPVAQRLHTTFAAPSPSSFAQQHSRSRLHSDYLPRRPCRFRRPIAFLLRPTAQSLPCHFRRPRPVTTGLRLAAWPLPAAQQLHTATLRSPPLPISLFFCTTTYSCLPLAASSMQNNIATATKHSLPLLAGRCHLSIIVDRMFVYGRHSHQASEDIGLGESTPIVVTVGEVVGMRRMMREV